MKIIVRCLVIALALTGAIATTSAKASSARTTVNISKTSAVPIPTCPPDDPDGCGIND
jgi:ribosomal protein L17